MLEPQLRIFPSRAIPTHQEGPDQYQLVIAKLLKNNKQSAGPDEQSYPGRDVLFWADYVEQLSRFANFLIPPRSKIELSA